MYEKLCGGILGPGRLLYQYTVKQNVVVLNRNLSKKTFSEKSFFGTHFLMTWWTKPSSKPLKREACRATARRHVYAIWISFFVDG
jgi:hypothetical protein